MNIPSIAHSDVKAKVQDSSAYDLTEERTVRRFLHSDFSRNPKKFSSELNLSYEFCQRVGQLHVPFRFSVRALLPLLRISGDSAVISFMASRLGYQIFRLPVEVADPDIDQAISDFLVTIGAVQKAAGEARVKKNSNTIGELKTVLNWIISISVRLLRTIEEYEKLPGRTAENGRR